MACWKEENQDSSENNLPGSASMGVIPGRLNGVFKSIQSQQLAKQEEGNGSSVVDQRLFVTTSGVLMYHLLMAA